uniref:Uncharacterized protein n=1 Tax=Ixodes ricinus TaxID=34613 RepID=A0A6B0UIK6_IXORI
MAGTCEGDNVVQILSVRLYIFFVSRLVLSYAQCVYFLVRLKMKLQLIVSALSVHFFHLSSVEFFALFPRLKMFNQLAQLTASLQARAGSLQKSRLRERARKLRT